MYYKTGYKMLVIENQLNFNYFISYWRTLSETLTVGSQKLKSCALIDKCVAAVIALVMAYQ